MDRGEEKTSSTCPAAQRLRSTSRDSQRRLMLSVSRLRRDSRLTARHGWTLDHIHTLIMKPHFTSRSSLRIGLFVFSALALFSFAAAFFVLISEDFVINGQVVPATDARLVVWRICLSPAGIVSAAWAWLCYRCCRRLRMGIIG
jgi:hypothetical protein